MGNGSPLCTTSCFHAFHEACLRTWLRQANRCPACTQRNITTQPLYASATGSNTNDREDQQADIEALQERVARAERRAGLAEAGREAREEQQAMFEQQQILQVQGLLFDLELWQGNFERSDTEVRRLNTRVRQLETAEQHSLHMTRKYERLERRYDRVRTDQGHLRDSMQAVMNKNSTPAWAADKVIVRNYTLAAIEDPAKVRSWTIPNKDI